LIEASLKPCLRLCLITESLKSIRCKAFNLQQPSTWLLTDSWQTIYNTSTCWSSMPMKHHWCSWSRCRSTRTYADCLIGFFMPSNFSAHVTLFLEVDCLFHQTVLGWLTACWRCLFFSSATVVWFWDIDLMLTHNWNNCVVNNAKLAFHELLSAWVKSLSIRSVISFMTTSLGLSLMTCGLGLVFRPC